MDSKGVITPEAWKQSCNDVVLLAEFPKYCWTNQETFRAKLVVANYSNKTIDGSFDWKLSRADGSVVDQGTFGALQIPEGGLFSVGELNVNLAAVIKASELSLDISLPGTGYSNTYPIWVYPAAGKPELPADIVVAEKLDASVFEKLHKGEKVLLFPETEDVKGNTVPGHFPPEFWITACLKESASGRRNRFPPELWDF